MSLYDDEDLGAPLPEVAKGWSTGIKMMQSHLQAKKLTPTSMGPPKSGFKDPITKHRTFSAPVLAPVIDLKSKKHIVDDPLTKSESRVCYPTIYYTYTQSPLIKSKFYKKRGATFFYDVTLKLGPLDFTQYRSKSSSF